MPDGADERRGASGEPTRVGAVVSLTGASVLADRADHLAAAHLGATAHAVAPMTAPRGSES